MRTLCFIPLAYLAGVDGFALFAPYVAMVLVTRYLFRTYQHRRAALAG